MSFLSGTVTMTRYRVRGPKPLTFGAEHLARLRDHARPQIASSDGVAVGWAAGDSYADTDFTEMKNVYPDHLLFDLWVETSRLPPDRLRAYYSAELKARAKDNPSGFASARQKREARAAARERLEHEAKDGRYKRWTLTPCCWDAGRNEVWVATTSAAQLGRFEQQFAQTFRADLTQPRHVGECPDPLTADRLARSVAPAAADAGPSRLVGEADPERPAWCAGDDDLGFLGNEFLLWLWWRADDAADGDTLRLQDGSELVYMLSGGVKLDCPLGTTGNGTLNHDGPARMPEAKRALATGKLPRKAGLTLVRHDQQYGVHLQAETLALSAVKLPRPPADAGGARAAAEHRLQACRDLSEALDLAFAAFLAVRLSVDWVVELPRLRRWLARAERGAKV